MSFWEWLFSFNGRIGRGRYWASFLVYLALAIVLSVVSTVAGSAGGQPAGIMIVPFAILGIAFLVSSLAVSVKRFHDRGKSGWWMALAFGLSILANIIAVAGGSVQQPNPIGLILSLGVSIWLLIDLGILPGQYGPNEYGPDPRA